MPATFDQRRSAADRELPFRARRDLQAIAAPLGGAAMVVVNDPISGESYHLSAAEHSILMALRRRTTLGELKRLVERQFAPQLVATAQLQQFVEQLYEKGLLIAERGGQAETLRRRGERRARRQRWSSVMQLLSIRVARFSVGPLVDWLHARTRWLSGWLLLCCAAGLAVVALASLLEDAQGFAARAAAAPALLRAGYLPLWLAVVAAIKTCHELGHALASRRCGARPQEAGLLLLAGAPALYCDVSDAWRLPEKRQRIAVSAAGMGVELVLAAVAVLVWQASPPGPVSAVCLCVVVVCSVGTLLINANPLLRYDGYYILSDWWEVPNLAERARGLVSAAWRQWLLGERPSVDPLIGVGKRRALWVYALLCKAYLATILGGALALMLRLARPYELQNVVYSVAAIVALGMVLPTATAAVKALANPVVRRRIRWLRGIASLAILAGAIAALWLTPISRRATAPIVVVPAQAHPLFAVTAGRIVSAQPIGAQVSTGDVVMQLANEELAFALEQQQGKVRELAVRIAQLQSLRATQPAAVRLLPATEMELADARRQREELQDQAASLTIRAPAAGRVAAAPDREDARLADDQLGVWTRSPLDPRNVGSWVEATTPLAVVIGGEQRLAWGAIDEADAPLVRPGQTVRVSLEQAQTEYLTGTVVRVSQRARRNKAERSQDAPRTAILGDDSYHVAEIALEASGELLIDSARGTAKIFLERSTIGDRVERAVREAWLSLGRQ